jgi:hypothetical protein
MEWRDEIPLWQRAIIMLVVLSPFVILYLLFFI